MHRRLDCYVSGVVEDFCSVGTGVVPGKLTNMKDVQSPHSLSGKVMVQRVEAKELHSVWQKQEPRTAAVVL
jgi:hypothetical protein